MNVYQIDLRLIATAYIKAESEEEAQKIIEAVLGDGIEFSDRHQSVDDNICVDGCVYNGLADNDEDIALSPAMTIEALATEGDTVDFTEELQEEAEDEDAEV